VSEQRAAWLITFRGRGVWSPADVRTNELCCAVMRLVTIAYGWSALYRSSGAKPVVARHAEYWNVSSVKTAAIRNSCGSEAKSQYDPLSQSAAKLFPRVASRASARPGQRQPLLAGARASATAASFLLSGGLDYEEGGGPDSDGMRLPAFSRLPPSWISMAVAHSLISGSFRRPRFQAINFTLNRA